MNVSRKILIVTVSGMLMPLTACNSDHKRNVPAVDSAVVPAEEEFHADNDIAMTVRSIADAIRVGEPLDTIDYNFDGVLTDGTGRPLYTDLKGAPGIWDVDVLSPTSAVIRNVNIGDLLPDDLESYIIGNLELTENDRVDSISVPVPEGAETAVYDFEGGYLRIDVRNTSATNGLEGAMVSITASRDLPSRN